MSANSINVIPALHTSAYRGGRGRERGGIGKGGEGQGEGWDRGGRDRERGGIGEGFG